MTCPEAASHLDEFIDNDLPADQTNQVREHLKSCDECRREYQLTKRLKSLLSIGVIPDPGEDYFFETETLILARTIDGSDETDDRPPTADQVRRQKKQAFYRALFSVAASVGILFAAIYLGSSQDNIQSRNTTSSAPILATADIRNLVGPETEPIFTEADNLRLAHGIMLIGSPGPLGRFGIFPDIIRTIPVDES